MSQVPAKHEIKTCPRCGRAFECRVNSPLDCACARVLIPSQTQAALRETYRDCLCPDCLTALAAVRTPSGDAADA